MLSNLRCNFFNFVSNWSAFCFFKRRDVLKMIYCFPDIWKIGNNSIRWLWPGSKPSLTSLMLACSSWTQFRTKSSSWRCWRRTRWPCTRRSRVRFAASSAAHSGPSTTRRPTCWSSGSTYGGRRRPRPSVPWSPRWNSTRPGTSLSRSRSKEWRTSPRSSLLVSEVTLICDLKEALSQRR